MNSRMTRYENKPKEVKQSSRTDKNDNLYQTFYRETSFAEYDQGSLESNLESLAVDLSKKNNYQKREDYHRVKEYDFIAPKPQTKQELEDFNTRYSTENKVYDINSVLEVARKNREQKDELEQKRKLRNDDYNVLNSKTLGEIEKYREEKRQRLLKQQSVDAQELSELIDTITKKTFLDEEHSRDLMSDLLPVETATDTIAPISEEQVEVKIDNSFYTRSMDLSSKDFAMDNSFDEEIKQSALGSVIKVILFIVLLAVIGGIIYFLLNIV